MWDAYEATCPSHIRKPNPHIKTRKGDKVYSRESYAQELYDMMQGFGGKIDMGELVTREQSAGRLLSQAVYARWENDN